MYVRVRLHVYIQVHMCVYECACRGQRTCLEELFLRKGLSLACDQQLGWTGWPVSTSDSPASAVLVRESRSLCLAFLLVF